MLTSGLLAPLDGKTPTLADDEARQYVVADSLVPPHEPPAIEVISHHLMLFSLTLSLSLDISF
jgi:hypothetical protein